MNAIKIALLTTALAASAANARDLGNGFSLTGEVELEYVSSGSFNEIMSFTDLTLGWRRHGGGAVGFGFDLSFVDLRVVSDGDNFNDLWAAAVLTTSFGEFAIGKPRPVLDRLVGAPQVGGAGYIDLVTATYGGIDGSFLAKFAMFSDLSSQGVTFKGTSGGFSYGAGLHRFKQGGLSVDGYEIGGTYTIGQTDIFAGFERLDSIGTNVDHSLLGLRYTADRWSVGGHLARLDAGFEEFSFAMLYGDYKVSDAFKVRAQYLNMAFGPDDEDFYGLSAEYGFAGGGFAELGVLSGGASDDLYSASVGFRF